MPQTFLLSQEISSHKLGGRKSEIKVHVVIILSGAQGETLSMLFFRLLVVLSDPWHSVACRLCQSLLSFHMAFFRVCLCVSKALSVYKVTSQLDLGLTLIQYNNYNYSWKKLCFWKRWHSEVLWDLCSQQDGL